MATVELNSIITIGNYKPFMGVNEVNIKKSLRSYMETAIIKLPGVFVLKKTKKEDKDSGNGELQQTANAFKRGDRISIQLGYNGSLKLEFTGFIARVNKTVPCEIECEGFAYLLHSIPVNKIWKNTTLKDVLKFIVQGTGIDIGDVPDAPMSKCQLIGESGISALESLKKMFGGALFIWMDGAVMNASFSYLTFTERPSQWLPDVIYRIGWNTLRDDQMKEHIAGDRPVEVIIEQRQKDGSYKRQQVGVKLANQERRRLQNIEHTETQNKIATALEEKQNYNGFEGKITTFLVPYCLPGYKAQIIDDRFNERSGNYLIESVEIDYSRSGARRILDLSRKLS